MKRFLSLILLGAMLLSLAACGKKPEGPAPTTAPTQPAGPTAPVIPDLSGQTAIVDTTGMTDLQKAIVVTAESFFMRGKYAQYDQYSLTSIGGELDRRTYGIMAPEDYTEQFVSYTDCSSFVFDVYNFALGMRITKSFPFTKTYCESSSYTVLKEQPVKDNFAAMSADELAVKEKEFRDTLQPGDIIVFRRSKSNSGHAMLYVGNGMKIHSTGTSYDYENAVDKGSEKGTYRYDSIENLFTPGNSGYLFDMTVYVILRPLAKFKSEIPAHTLARMELMRGIKAEKLCSHTYGQTVNPGDTMTFTFRLQNNSSIAKPLTVTDTVPAGTTYVSGAQWVQGDQLTWIVTVPAGETKEISYSVTVDAATAPGTYIESNSSVSGVAVNCPRVLVAKTLTQAQQKALTDALAELGSTANGIVLVNAIYEKVCGKAVFTHQDTEAVWSDLMASYGSSGTVFTGKKPLAPMVAPRMYGGRLVIEQNTAPVAYQYRTRLVTCSVLVIGDVVLADDQLYLFTGDGLRSLNEPQNTDLKSPESLLSAKKFVVLRPSMTF